MVTFISREIADFYCRQALPITITRHIRLLLMSRVKIFPSQQITLSHRRLSLLNMSVLI